MSFMEEKQDRETDPDRGRWSDRQKQSQGKGRLRDKGKGTEKQRRGRRRGYETEKDGEARRRPEGMGSKRQEENRRKCQVRSEEGREEDQERRDWRPVGRKQSQTEDQTERGDTVARSMDGRLRERHRDTEVIPRLPETRTDMVAGKTGRSWKGGEQEFRQVPQRWFLLCPSGGACSDMHNQIPKLISLVYILSVSNTLRSF